MEQDEKEPTPEPLYVCRQETYSSADKQVIENIAVEGVVDRVKHPHFMGVMLLNKIRQTDGAKYQEACNFAIIAGSIVEAFEKFEQQAEIEVARLQKEDNKPKIYGAG